MFVRRVRKEGADSSACPAEYGNDKSDFDSVMWMHKSGVIYGPKRFVEVTHLCCLEKVLAFLSIHHKPFSFKRCPDPLHSDLQHSSSYS